MFLRSAYAFGALAMATFLTAGISPVFAQAPRPPEAVGDSTAPAAPTTADKNPDTTAPAAANAPSSPAPAETSQSKASQKHSMKHGEQNTASHKVTVQFTYNSRVLVPRGADLKVTILGAGNPTTQAFKTRNDAPPYTETLKIPPDAGFPLKASVTLTSRIGHQFTADFEIKPENLKGAPIDVTMDAK